MLNWLIIIVTIARLLSTCTALSLPQGIIEKNGSPQQGNRAQIGGIMALFPDNNDGAVFIFVIDEFRGEQLVRQSICNAYMANQMEMIEEYIPCEDIYELPMISTMNFDAFEMVYRYIYKFMYNEKDPFLGQPGFSHQTMQLKLVRASSFKIFNFFVQSNQFTESNEIIVTENAWDCRPHTYFPTGSQCLWNPRNSDARMISPYQWVENQSGDQEQLSSEH